MNYVCVGIGIVVPAGNGRCICSAQTYWHALGLSTVGVATL